MSDSTENVGRKLAELLKAWPGSQRELADKIGVTPQQMSNFLRGAMPKPDKLLSLAKTLDADLYWLLDDAQDATPRRPEPLLIEATDTDFVTNGRDRYIRVAIELDQGLRMAEGLDKLWARRAWWFMREGNFEKLPEAIRKTGEFVEELNRTAYFLDRLKTFYDPFYLRAHLPQDAAEPVKYVPEKLLARFSILVDEHVGYKAIGDYMRSMRDSLLEKFMQQRVGYFMARLIDDPELADLHDRHTIREKLIEKKYLTPEGKPTQFPDFQMLDPDFQVNFPGDE